MAPPSESKERATQLPDALVHTAQPNTHGAERFPGCARNIDGKTFSEIFDFQVQRAIPKIDANLRSGTAGMAVNIGEAFLERTEGR